MKNNIISLDEWRNNHELLYGICILGNGYLEATAQNAMQTRGMKLTREEVAKFQIENGLVDNESNNLGVIDVDTFFALISIFDNDMEVYEPILEQLNKSIKEYEKALKPSLFTRIKNLFTNK